MVSRVGNASVVTSSIHCWSRSRLIRFPSGSLVQKRKLTLHAADSLEYCSILSLNQILIILVVLRRSGLQVVGCVPATSARKKHRSGGDPLATLYWIQPVHESNQRSSQPPHQYRCPLPPHQPAEFCVR